MAPSVFRCGQCGDGTRLRGWAHVNIHGAIGPGSLIERTDYEDDMAFDPVIDESVACRIHGEDFIEKLVDGRYTLVWQAAALLSPGSLGGCAGGSQVQAAVEVELDLAVGRPAVLAWSGPGSPGAPPRGLSDPGGIVPA